MSPRSSLMSACAFLTRASSTATWRRFSLSRLSIASSSASSPASRFRASAAFARSSLSRFCVCWRSRCFSPISAPSRRWAGAVAAASRTSATKSRASRVMPPMSLLTPAGEQPTEGAEHRAAGHEEQHLGNGQEGGPLQSQRHRQQRLEPWHGQRIHHLEYGEGDDGGEETLSHALQEPR